MARLIIKGIWCHVGKLAKACRQYSYITKNGNSSWNYRLLTINLNLKLS